MGHLMEAFLLLILSFACAIYAIAFCEPIVLAATFLGVLVAHGMVLTAHVIGQYLEKAETKEETQLEEWVHGEPPF